MSRIFIDFLIAAFVLFFLSLWLWSAHPFAASMLTISSFYAGTIYGLSKRNVVKENEVSNER